RALAGARLPDDRDQLAALHREVHAAENPDRPARGGPVRLYEPGRPKHGVALRAPPDRLGRREADDAEGGPRGRGRAQQDREGERPRDEARREVEELLARASGPRIDGDTQPEPQPQARDTAAHRDHERLAQDLAGEIE